MLNTSTKVLLLIALLGLVSPVLAQEQEGITILPGTVRRTTGVRRKPSAGGPVIRRLAKNTSVRILSPEARRGFWRVILTRGRQGYVSIRDVAITKTVMDAVSLVASRAAPCVRELNDCTPEGCADPGSKKGLFNKAKNFVPSGTRSILIGFPDLRALQRQANALVDQGKDLSREQRASIRSLTVANGKAGEGKLARLVGFIVNDSDPHANTGETVNCNLPNQANNDFHISLALRSGDSEFQGVVVEMIPHSRPEAWSLLNLRKVKRDKLKVMVVGGLFYDNDHVVNSDPSDDLGGQPKRFSLWEIHPITQFFVCRRAGNACSPTNVREWTKLEDF